MDLFVIILSLTAVVFLVVVNREHMRLVSFEDVYDLRFAAAESTRRSVAGDYLTSWLIYAFISYLCARGLAHRKKLLLFVAVILSVLVYASEGHKSALLLPLLSAGFLWVWRDGRNFFSRFVLVLAGLVLFVVLALPNDGVGMWVKSILLNRLMASNGWVASKYFEFFTPGNYTFYTHISPVNAAFGGYPFGGLSLGQVIGLEYSGTELANHNASFWASDGFAAAGSVGVLIITPFVACLLYLVNRVMTGLDGRFVIVWMSGFIIALMNLPFTTALFSGGGAVILVQAWLLTRKGSSLSAAKLTGSQTTRQIWK